MPESMKKVSLFFVCGALAFAACQKEPLPQTPSKDADLTGATVSVTSIPAGTGSKVFVLNEGGMGANNASLDFLRISDGMYVTGAFKKMNPDIASGLGDVGNDIAVRGDEVWMVINNSGIVEVVSAKDETEIAAIQIPTPRNIAFDDNYAYVTSWAGAYANYTVDDDSCIEELSGYSNPFGQVYRIDLKTKKVDGSIEVGYQPEGVACHNGKLYVANSGGISSQLPPAFSYDNTVSIIDTKIFKVIKTVEVQVNLKNVYSDGTGNIYVTSMGNYWNVHSGLYMIDPSGKVKHISDFVSVASLNDGTLYCIGSGNEFDWYAAKTWKGFRVKNGAASDWNVSFSATVLYGLAVLAEDSFLIGDAGDYFNRGRVKFYHNNAEQWSATAGVCPGHFAIW